MTVTRVPAGESHACAPKSGEIICVRAKRKDRSVAHEHFARDQWRKAVGREKEIKAQEEAPGRAQTPKGAETFEEYAERWRAAQRPADPDVMRYALRRAYSVIGADRLDGIDGLDLMGLQSRLLAPDKEQLAEGQTRYARGSVELSMFYVKTILRQAFADGVVPVDPTTRVHLPRRDSLDNDGVVTAEDVPTHEEAIAILAATPTAYRLGVALGLGCGLRVGEVLGLTARQVDLAAGTVKINAQQQRRGRVSPKTWRGVRTIEVPDVVLFELRRALRNDLDPDRPIFTGPRGGVPRREEFYAKAWRPALRGAGLAEDRYVFHAARHYAASAMLSRGVPIPEVADYLGDAVETVSRVYAHKIRKAVPMARNALNQALAPPPEAVSTDAASSQGE